MALPCFAHRRRNKNTSPPRGGSKGDEAARRSENPRSGGSGAEAKGHAAGAEARPKPKERGKAAVFGWMLEV